MFNYSDRANYNRHEKGIMTCKGICIRHKAISARYLNT